MLALWLAALWLPLTLHCPLAGLICSGESAGCCEQHCGCSHSGDCHSDVCKIIESGNYIPNKATLPMAPAFWIGIESLAPMDGRHPLPLLTTLTQATGAPPGWTRVWQFVFRAALAPRAPSALG